MKDNSSDRAWPGVLIAGFVGAIFMFFLQSASAHFPGYDSYYHLKMARLLPSMGFTDQFPWLHWTFFRDNFVSHHYGFHVALSGFVWLSETITSDLLAGGKAFTILCMATTFALSYAILRMRRVPNPLIWLLFVGCLPWHFWLRMSYVRAPCLGLPLMLCAIMIILRERPLLLGLLAFLFAQVYSGAVLFPLIPLAFLGGHIMAGSVTRKHGYMFFAAAAGIAAGFVISPYFPENFSFMKVQLFDTGLGAPAEVGSEWKTYDAWFFFTMSAPIIVLWSCSLFCQLRRGERMEGQSLGLLLLNLGFLVLTIKARRFIEYWPLFSLLNAADMCRFPFRAWCKEQSDKKPTFEWRYVLVILVTMMIVAPNLVKARSHIFPRYNHTLLRPALKFLATSTPRGSMVLTDDWDLFPPCFYYNHHNTYAVGLDPMFTQAIYPDLWERYALITQGKTPTTFRPAGDTNDVDVSLTDLSDVFLADYVLVLSDHAAFYRQLSEKPSYFQRIYAGDVASDSNRQPYVSIFKILKDPVETRP